MKTIMVVGLGSIGKRHASNLESMDHKVIGYDPPLTQIMNGMPLGSEHLVDAYVICTPTHLHAEHLRMYAELGKPIFIEKPISAEWLTVMPQNLLMVGYNMRFHSCVKKAKDWIMAGKIGTPLWANFTVAQFSDKPDYLRDGVILNWSHEIDLALYLLGPAVVKASLIRRSQNLASEDMADILLHHWNQCQTTVHMDYVSKPEMRTIRIIGSQAAIEIDLAHSRVAYLVERTDTLRALETFRAQDSFNENYHEEMKAFINRIDGKETIGCTGAEALEVLKICLEAKK